MRCGVLSHLVCVWCALVGDLQGICASCQRSFLPDRPSRKQCGTCRKRKHSDTTDEQENIDPRLQLAENASQLMVSLPTHSHHRAPLLSALSQHMPSSAAAPLLHASPSYIRDCKRKDVSNSDLLQQKYPTGVKRRRLSDDTLGRVFSFLVGACPTPSGSRHLNFKQYVKDDDLYAAYQEFCKGQFFTLAPCADIRLTSPFALAHKPCLQIVCLCV